MPAGNDELFVQKPSPWDWNPGELSPLGQSLTKDALSLLFLWEGIDAITHASYSSTVLHDPWDYAKNRRVNFGRVGALGWPNYTPLGSGNTAPRVPAGISLNLYQSGFGSNAHGLDFGASDPVSVPSGSDFTFTVAGVIEHLYSGNGGFIRSGVGSSPVGSSFCIFESSQPRPWIRWNGADILRVTSGASFSLDEFVVLHYVVRSADNVEFWVNGVKTNSASHATATPAIDWRWWGWQSTADSVKGNIGMSQFHARAKTEEEIVAEARDPWAIMRREDRVPVFAFAPPSVGGPGPGTYDETIAPAATGALTSTPANVLSPGAAVLASTGALTSSALLTLDASGALVASGSLNTSSALVADVAALLASTAALTTVGGLTLEQAATLAATAALTSTGGALFEETAAMVASAGFTGSVDVTLVAGAAFPATADLASSRDAVLSPQAVLAGSASIALSAAGSTYSATINLDAIAEASAAPGGDSASVALLGAVATISASARLRWEPAGGVTLDWTERPSLTDIWSTRSGAGGTWNEDDI